MDLVEIVIAKEFYAGMKYVTDEANKRQKGLDG